MIWGEIFLENSSFNNHHNFWGLPKFQFDCCNFNTDHTLSIYLYLLIYPWRQKLHTTTSYAISSLKYSSFCIQCFLLVVTLFRDGESHKFSLLKMISLLPLPSYFFSFFLFAITSQPWSRETRCCWSCRRRHRGPVQRPPSSFLRDPLGFRASATSCVSRSSCWRTPSSCRPRGALDKIKEVETRVIKFLITFEIYKISKVSLSTISVRRTLELCLLFHHLPNSHKLKGKWEDIVPKVKTNKFKLNQS